MHPDTKLRREVPDACIGGRAVVVDVVGRAAEGWVLVVRPDDSASPLGPRNDLAMAGADEVPAEQDWSDGDAGEGSTDGVRG